MGEYAAQLGRTLDADLGAVQRQQDTLGSGGSTTEGTAAQLSDVSAGLQYLMRGEAGEAAQSTLSSLSEDIATLSRHLTTLASAAGEARAAIADAQDSYHELPRGTVTPAERRELTQAGLFDAAGNTTGLTPAMLAAQREQAREQKASAALAALDGRLGLIAMPVGAEEDFVIDDSPAGSSSTTGRSSSAVGPGGYGGGVAGGLTGGTVGGYGGGTGGSGSAVSPTWQQPGGSGVGVIGGGGSGVGTGGSGGGVVGPGWSGGSGSGVGGGHVPGAGDGSSADGSVGGVVPGGGGAGAGGVQVGGAVGGTGSGGGLGGIGAGAGGLAGGLAIGGGALGGAALGRLGAGGAGGAGGLGGGVAGGAFGSVGVGAGGRAGVSVGGVGAGGATGGLGASGSGLAGSTSTLGQGAQTGAAGGAASGARSGGGMTGAPMGGGAGAGGAKDAKRRGSSGLLAPEIDVEEGAARPDLGAAAGAGGRDSLPAARPVTAARDDDEW